MKKELLTRTVSEELEHIVRDIKGSDQNAFRMMYNMIRRRDLGRDPEMPRTESLLRAIEAIRRSSPDFAPLYDEDYFEQ